MNKAYSRINWQNSPSVASPINDRNLNKMDGALDTIDDRVISLDTAKASASELLATIINVEFDSETGVFTFTKKDNSTFTVDTDLEKVAVNFDYDDDPTSAHYQQMVITLSDGTVKYIDMSAFITITSFVDSSTIHFDVSGSTVTATIKAGSITDSMLQPSYLADITVQAQNAAASATSASDSATAASGSADDAAASALLARQAVSEGYYVSFTINNDGELIYSKTIGTETTPIITNLGMVTAYGEAKSKGYSGTEEQFGTVLANAATYATTAQTAATTATTKAGEAATSATNAATSATTASTKATEASTSATNAATSATNAAASETAAGTSETNAAASATAAAASATSAATDAATIAASVSAATTAATNAAASATSAGNSATAAAASATAAASSETNAANSESNAYAWEEQARQIAQGLSGALLPMGTITFSQLPTSNINVGWMYNISDAFTTDSRFKEGAGVFVGAGANVYYTADEKWDILAGTTVSGVKGDAEQSYRQGNVNITPTNIGLGNVDNTSDASKIDNDSITQNSSNKYQAVKVNGHTVESNVPANAVFTDTTDLASMTGTLGVAHGGTGQTSLTSNAVLTGNGTSGVNQVSSASGALYATSANGTPQFGTLPVAQGGTGATDASSARTNLGLGTYATKSGAAVLIQSSEPSDHTVLWIDTSS